MIVLPEGTMVEGRFAVERNCDYVIALMNPSVVPPEVLTHLSDPRVLIHNDFVERSLNEIESSFDLPPSLYDLFLEGWTLQALAHLAGQNDSSKKKISGGLGDVRLRRVLDFIAQDISTPVSLDVLAGVSGLSKRHFLRAFQRSTGKTPARYIRDLRVDKAKVLLTSDKADLTEIAMVCGFCHAQHFSNSFKKLTGLTPSDYRSLMA